MSPILLIYALVAPSAPQAPFAAGPFISVTDVIRAAHECSIEYIRIETYNSPEMGEARLFFIDEIPHKAERCLTAWETKNGKRLYLKPPG